MQLHFPLSAMSGAADAAVRETTREAKEVGSFILNYGNFVGVDYAVLQENRVSSSYLGLVLG